MTHYGTHHSTVSGIVLAAALASAALAASACTSTENGGPAATSDASTPAAAASPTLAPEQIVDPEEAAIAAYTRYWDTVVAAFESPDGDFADFEAIASGQALEYAKSVEQRGLDESIHGTGVPTHDIEIKESVINDEIQQVVVRDCSDSSGMEVLDANDEPLPDEEYGPTEIQARIELLEGRWIVTVMAVQEIGTCVPDS